MNTAAPPFTTGQRILFMICISFVTLLLLLDYSIANIAIPYIAGGLAVSTEEGIYVITFFSIGNAIGLGLTGWLTLAIGQVRLLLISVFLFTLTSWLCGLSPTLLLLVIARFLQGLVAGPMLPLSQALLIKEALPGKQARDLALWSTVVITGPVIGPLLGGYISYWYHWSWIFYINIPIGIACLAILWFLLRSRESEIEKTPLDLWGILLVSVAVTCFQIFLDKGQDWDWWNSIAIRAAFITCVIGTTLFIIREQTTKHPFFQLRLFRIFTFSLAIVLLVVSYAIYFGSIVIVPLWLQEYMGYDAIQAGIAVAPLGFGPILFSLIAPKIIEKVGNTLTLALSYAAFAVSAFYTTSFTTSVDIHHIGFSRFLMGLGFICWITPLIQISIIHVPKKDLSGAVSVFYFFRALSGAIGGSFFTTLWQRRMIFHHERLASTLTPFNPLGTEAESLPLLNQAVDVQASMLSINDAFHLMGWLYVVSMALLLGYYAVFRYRKRRSLLVQMTENPLCK